MWLQSQEILHTFVFMYLKTLEDFLYGGGGLLPLLKYEKKSLHLKKSCMEKTIKIA